MVPHILIVDADSSAAQVTRAVVLRTLPGVTVAVAPTFERAQLSMQEQRPDALIIDPSPQSRDGTRLIEQFKVICPDALVIVVASMPTPTLRRTMLGLRVDAYLEKPALLPEQRQQLHALVWAGASDAPLTNTPDS